MHASLVGICGERELRYQKEAAPHIGKRKVHLAGIIGKHPVPEHALEEPFGRRLVITPFDTDQHEQSVTDLGDRRARDHNTCAADTLQKPDHRSPVPGRRPKKP